MYKIFQYHETSITLDRKFFINLFVKKIKKLNEFYIIWVVAICEIFYQLKKSCEGIY